jgi:hypothetical protein
LEKSDFHFPLFPNWARLVGILLILPGLYFGYLYFFGSRPVFFETKVFAMVTTYVENRFFVVAQTNLLDELFSIFCISGLVLIVFSREKTEKEGDDLIRAKALIKAVYIALGIWLCSFLVIFGWAIFVVSALLFILFLITYYIVFLVLKNKKG